jgi:hypothetical protein
MTKLNSLARARVIGPEGGPEDGAAIVGVGEGAAGVNVLVVSTSSSPSRTEVVLDGNSSSSPRYGFKSATLKLVETPNSAGRSRI